METQVSNDKIPVVVNPESKSNWVKDAFDIHKESMEIIASPHFKKGIEIEVEKNRKAIAARPEPKEGFRYKRIGVNQLMDEGNYTAEFFLKNAIPVLCKTSALPASQRLPILLVCLTAFDYSRKKIETKINKKQK